MHRVIINADDFGLTDGVTTGILECMDNGVVCTTTAMACVEGAAARLERWGPRVPGRIGAHLQLTTGTPLTHRPLTPSLADASGRFPARKQAVAGAPVEEIVVEWEAQLALIRATGIAIGHLDSHHHVHKLPNPFKAFCEIAVRHKLPARAASASMVDRLRAAGIVCPDTIVLDYYEGDLRADHLIRLLREASAGAARSLDIELMCHPGYPCAELAALSGYTQDRERELETLRLPELRARLADEGFVLTTFSELNQPLEAQPDL